MQRGQPRPDLPPEQEEYVRQIARQWMESPLYQAVADHDKAKDTGDRYSISSSGIVEGSFTARDSSVQIARHAKNPLAVTRQMAFHALKSYGAFTSSEWEILTKAALNQSWVEKRGVSARYSHVYTHPENREAIFHETAIADVSTAAIVGQ